MIRVGVISDTHLRRPTRRLEEVVEKHFIDVNLIFHAGDIRTQAVLHAFKGKELFAVCGNNDDEDIRRRLPQKELIVLNSFRIGLTHGWGPPFRLRKRVAGAFENIDCLVYGHSHWAVNKRMGNVLYFNPGAFTGGVTTFWRPSIGLLTVDQEITGKIIRI
jgi:putative phosphoesterase